MLAFHFRLMFAGMDLEAASALLSSRADPSWRMVFQHTSEPSPSA